METITTTTYIALDGREFNSKEDCLFYEETLKRSKIIAQPMHSQHGFAFQTASAIHTVTPIDSKSQCIVDKATTITKPGRDNKSNYATVIHTCLQLHDDVNISHLNVEYNEKNLESLLSRLYMDCFNEEAFIQTLKKSVIVTTPSVAILSDISSLTSLSFDKLIDLTTYTN